MSVELRGVSRSFGEITAVRDVSLTVPTGSIVALLGPSGCGKTTTLRVVAGFETPDAGTVTVGGRIVAGPGAWVPPERRRVGMVFQQLALFPHMNVGGNVGYGLRGMSRAARADRVKAMLELVDLAGYERRRPEQLSGGEAQRVAVARALAPAPDVVLLDEPFSSLDVGLRVDVREQVVRILREAGATAILVTHDQDEALSLGDEVVVMLGGAVAQAGAPESVYRQPASAAVAEFLGDANLLDGEVTGGRLASVVGPLTVDARDGHATALVRPEDLDLIEDDDGTAEVREVQYFGHDQLVTLSVGGATVRARLHAQRRFSLGARVRIVVRDDRAVAFSQ
ncbi:MAG TPA: ABC transporter ATP-binding protein [Acidimicrobiales bacterium]|nr:ABC transporter ATP-binding protein [Acidimicrobiales bacterium]